MGFKYNRKIENFNVKTKINYKIKNKGLKSNIILEQSRVSNLPFNKKPFNKFFSWKKNIFRKKNYIFVIKFFSIISFDLICLSKQLKLIGWS